MKEQIYSARRINDLPGIGRKICSPGMENKELAQAAVYVGIARLLAVAVRSVISNCGGKGRFCLPLATKHDSLHLRPVAGAEHSC